MNKRSIISLSVLVVVLGYMILRSTDQADGTGPDGQASGRSTGSSGDRGSAEARALMFERSKAERALVEKARRAEQEEATRQMSLITDEMTKLGWSARMELFKEEFIPQINERNWKSALAALEQYPRASAEIRLLRLCRLEALNKIGEVGGRQAMLHVYDLNEPDDIDACLKGWMLREPEEALAWVELVAAPDSRAEIWNAHAKLLYSKESWLGKKSSKKFIGKVVELHGTGMAENIFQRMADDIISNEDPGTAYLGEMFTVLASETVSRNLAEGGGGLEGSAEWLRGHIGEPYVTGAAAGKTLQMLTQEHGGEAAIEWMDENKEQHPEMNVALYDPIISEWGRIDGLEAVGEWLNEQADHPQYDRFAYAFAKKVVGSDRERAEMWAESISDEKLREELQKGGLLRE